MIVVKGGGPERDYNYFQEINPAWLERMGLTGKRGQPPIDDEPAPDDDVRANLRHLCDEAVNFLRAQLFQSHPIDQERVQLAMSILKELGCPPTG